MSSFLKHAAGAASALSKTAFEHPQHPQPHRPQPVHHSSSQFSQSHAYHQTTTTSQQQQGYQQSTQSPYGGSDQYTNDPYYQQQQQQGYQQSFQSPYGGTNQYNPNYNYQQQQYNQNAQITTANQQAADNALLAAQISAATTPQPLYNVQSTTDNQVSPMGSYTDPNAVVADPSYDQSRGGAVDQQDYSSAAAYQATPTTDPSMGVTQGDQTTSSYQSEPQPTMDTSAGSVQVNDQTGGYQPTSAMDSTTTSAQPDQITSNDNSGSDDDDEGCFTCLCRCCCAMCCQ